MRQLRITLLLILTALFALPTLAYDFEFDGLYYDILDEDAKTCAVTGYVSEPVGELIIPSAVSDGLVEYTVMTIGNKAFRYCRDITSVIFPDSLITIESAAFSGCTSLTSVTFPESLTIIKNAAFYECDGLTSLTFPDSLITIEEEAFFNCYRLKSVILPASLSTIGHYAFYECTGLTSVTYNATVPITIKGDDIFVDIINEGGNIIYRRAVLYMPNATLTDIESTSPWNNFMCISAKDGISIDSGHIFKYDNIYYSVVDAEARTCKVGDYYVSNMFVEGELIIPSVVSDGVAEYTVIEMSQGALVNCPDLISVTLPESLTIIEYGAFSWCTGLTSVTYNATVPIEASSNVFDYKVYENAVLYMPNATLADIEATSPWNNFMRISAKDGVKVSSNVVFNSDGIDYSVVDTDSRTCRVLGYRDSDVVQGEVVIPSTVSDGLIEYTVTEIGSSAFRECSGLISITFPESLTTIGDDAFFMCEGLTSLTLPESLTTIGSLAFGGCYGLTSVIFPESLTTIGNGAFFSCHGLVSIILPESLITIEDDAFYNCISLTSVTYNAAKPIEASYSIFYSGDYPSYSDYIYKNAILYMPNVSLVDIEATSPWNKFAQIASKDGISLSSGSVFNYEGLKYSVIDAEARTCEVIGYEDIDFAGSDLVIPSTVSVNIADFGMLEYTVTEIGEKAFNECRDLISVSLPASLTTIGYSAFEECESLTSVTLPKSLTTIGVGAFRRCTSLTSVILPDSLTTIEYGAFRECTSLTSVILPDSLTTIEYGAFKTCSSLTTVSLPASLTTIEEVIFEECYAIKNVTYNAVTPITARGDLFEFTAYNIATLYMPNATLADIQATVPWNLFSHIVANNGGVSAPFEYDGVNYSVVDTEARTCKTAQSENVYGEVVIPSTVSDGIWEYTVVEIGQSTFYQCMNLTSVTLPESVASIGWGAFYQCTGLKSMTLPESVTSIDWGAFYQCTGLTSVHFPESLTSIGELAFYQCTGLKSINLPESLTSIGELAFRDCVGLSSLVLPESLTSIGELAFRDCKGLTSVTLPESLTSIGDAAFIACDAIMTVNYDAVVPIEGEEGTFEESVYNTATLNMPNASLADIKATVPWNKFRHVIAKDGTLPELTDQDFEYEGVVYTIIDEEARTCRTRNGEGRRAPGNQYEGALVIPATALNGTAEYTVTEIGEYGFNGCAKLLSVTIPASVANIGDEAFGNCQRLTSLVWHGNSRLENSVTDAIGNPNLLVYVDAAQYAPADMDSNVVVMSAGSGEGECERLVLTPGYPFSPVQAFTSRYSTMTKEFTQTTPIDGCAGWETIVLPFDVTSVSAAQGELTPFAVLTDIDRQYPYWLYEADPVSDWKAAGSIRAGVPYIISMPNNKAYEPQYCISGPVTFTNTESVRITPVDAEQYVVEWNSGHKFCPLWLPLDNAQAVMAMGLNVGMDNLTDDAGQLLEPGSAFHIDVEPRPLEAYVTRLGGVRALRIRGAELSHVSLTKTANGLEMETADGSLHLLSDTDRTVDVFRIDGVRVASVRLHSGETYTIDGLVKGVYIVAGRKVMIK